jgi:hypothetical protein
LQQDTVFDFMLWFTICGRQLLHSARRLGSRKMRTTPREKKGIYESESDDDVEDIDDQSSSDEEIDEHPRSFPIPPPPKRTRHVLEEVTNDECPARPKELRGSIYNVPPRSGNLIPLRTGHRGSEQQQTNRIRFC